MLIFFTNILLLQFIGYTLSVLDCYTNIKTSVIILLEKKRNTSLYYKSFKQSKVVGKGFYICISLFF